VIKGVVYKHAWVLEDGSIEYFVYSYTRSDIVSKEKYDALDVAVLEA